MNANHRDEVQALVSRLEAAWNQADPRAFATEFAEDADFVNVRGDYASGRKAIADGHEHIWKTIYSGSTVSYRLVRLRELTAEVLIAHLDAELHVPAGPLAGDLSALPSLVLVKAGGAWQVASFHNTWRASQEPRREAS